MTDKNTTISVITLDKNGLNSTIKRHSQSDKIFKKTQT